MGRAENGGIDEDRVREYANRVLAPFATIPKEYWDRVLNLVNAYFEQRRREECPGTINGK